MIKRSFLITLLLYVFAVPLLAGNTAALTYLLGDVMVQLPEHQEAVTAKWNMELPEGAVVITGSDSKAEITLPDNSVIRVTANSRFKLEKIDKKENNRSFLMKILEGGIFGKISKMFTGSVEIKSPIAVIAIRGTEFAVWQVADSVDEVQVLEGKVTVFNTTSGDSISLSEGYKLNIFSDKPLSTPVQLSFLENKMLKELANDDNFKKPEIKQEKSVKETEEKAEKTEKEEKPERANKPEPTIKNDEPSDKPSATQPVPEDTSSDKGTGSSMGAGFGAVTIDGKTYTQFALRPEFSIGKLGVVLDLTVYIDENGNIREENWNDFADIFEKMYYVRWAQKGDPFYLKIGAVENYTMGYGLLMNNYSNVIEYPTVIRPGIELGIQKGRWYFETMLNNVKEVGTPGGLVAANVVYHTPFKLELGLGTVVDVNQYAGLSDNDEDGVPDMLDDFPGDKKYSVDSDGDGIPDVLDPDRDGDGYTDNDPLNNNDYDFDEANLKPEPFNIKDNTETLISWVFNLAYPLVKSKALTVIPYAEIAGFGGYGYGFSAPGVMGNVAFLKYKAEFRKTNSRFIPGYFNQTYELDRIAMVQDSTGNLTPVTKEEMLDNVKDGMSGYLVGAGFNLFKLVDFYAEYQDMSQKERNFNSLQAQATLNTAFLPKIKQATAYYNQYNVDKLFSPSDGTVLGYRLMYELTAGAYLMFDFRQTYRDLNGDGKYKGGSEIIKTINIGTYFSF